MRRAASAIRVGARLAASRCGGFASRRVVATTSSVRGFASGASDASGGIPWQSVAVGAGLAACAYEAARSFEARSQGAVAEASTPAPATPSPPNPPNRSSAPAASKKPAEQPAKAPAEQPAKAPAEQPAKAPAEPAKPPPVPVAKSDGELFYAQLLSQRRVFLNGRVDDKSAHSVIGKLLFLDAVDHEKPIILYINSGGGVVTSGLAIYDVMQHVRPPVYTVCLGHAESMAAVLLSAGERGHRYALPNARVMIHQPHHVISGQTTDIIIKASKAERTRGSLSAIIQKHTGKGAEEVEAALERDTYMTAEEAVAFGIVDRAAVSAADLDERKGGEKKRE